MKVREALACLWYRLAQGLGRSCSDAGAVKSDLSEEEARAKLCGTLLTQDTQQTLRELGAELPANARVLGAGYFGVVVGFGSRVNCVVKLTLTPLAPGQLEVQVPSANWKGQVENEDARSVRKEFQMTRRAHELGLAHGVVLAPRVHGWSASTLELPEQRCVLTNLCMELAGASLASSLLTLPASQAEPGVQAAAASLRRCFKVMRENGLVHGDLHPGNMAWQGKKVGQKYPDVVLLDWGDAKHVRDPATGLRHQDWKVHHLGDVTRLLCYLRQWRRYTKNSGWRFAQATVTALGAQVLLYILELVFPRYRPSDLESRVRRIFRSVELRRDFCADWQSSTELFYPYRKKLGSLLDKAARGAGGSEARGEAGPKKRGGQGR